jgi:N-alpha-acetyltransferase 50
LTLAEIVRNPVRNDQILFKQQTMQMVQTSISAWLTKPEPQKKQNHVPLKEGPVSNSTEAAVQDDEDTTSNGSSQQLKNKKKKKKKAFRLKPLPLPPNASFSTITSEHIGAYMRMTALLLPIPYPKKFFEETVEDPITASICLIALWSHPSIGGIQQSPKHTVVSGIRCRLLAPSLSLPQGKDREKNSGEPPTLYIAALTTLAPYRGHGLASALFRRILSRAIREYGVTTVTAHRWEANEEARGWYASHGFKEIGFTHDYYRRLKPSGAFLLERKIGPQDLLNVDEED